MKVIDNRFGHVWCVDNILVETIHIHSYIVLLLWGLRRFGSGVFSFSQSITISLLLPRQFPPEIF